MTDLRYVTVTEAEWKAKADEIDRLRAVIRAATDFSDSHHGCTCWTDEQKSERKRLDDAIKAMEAP